VNPLLKLLRRPVETASKPTPALKAPSRIPTKKETATKSPCSVCGSQENVMTVVKGGSPLEARNRRLLCPNCAVDALHRHG
jgi:hypothetical protein